MRNSTPCNRRRFGRIFLNAALVLGLLVPGLLLPGGCAPKKPVAPGPANSWDLFKQRFGSLPDGVRAFKIMASLFYSESGKGHRTVLDLWGDFNGPVRLDVQAGIGASLAFVRDGGPDGGPGGSGWLAVLPSDNKAYVHPDSLAGQAALGIPLPFTLHHLARLASGDYSFLFPSPFDRAEPDGDATAYHFSSGPASSLVLDKSGLPEEITGPAANPWVLTLSRFTGGRTGTPWPEKMELALPGGGKAVLRIKSRELKVAPWPEGTLDLPVPDNVVILQLNPEYTP